MSSGLTFTRGVICLAGMPHLLVRGEVASGPQDALDLRQVVRGDETAAPDDRADPVIQQAGVEEVRDCPGRHVVAPGDLGDREMLAHALPSRVVDGRQPACTREGQEVLLPHGEEPLPRGGSGTSRCASGGDDPAWLGRAGPVYEV